MEESISTCGKTSPLLVEVETDEGLTGIGEACIERTDCSLAVRRIVELGFKPILLNEDPLNIHKLWYTMYHYCDDGAYGRGGLASFAIHAVDVALWDIFGKAMHQPAHTLLGGNFRDQIRVYASAVFNMESPEETAKEAKRYANEGYTAIKFGWGLNREHPFGIDAEKDEEIVRLIREAIGPDVQIMVDHGRFANWTLSQAIQMTKRLSKYNIFWLEEPLPPQDLDGYAALRSSVDVHIAAGESEYTRFGFKELLTKGAVDIVQPDVTRVGGLTESKKIVDLAEMWNVMMVPHAWSSAINVAAAIQLLAATPRAFLMEYRKQPSPLMTGLIKKPFTFKNGSLVIPKAPGLGIELDYATVEQCSIKDI